MAAPSMSAHIPIFVIVLLSAVSCSYPSLTNRNGSETDLAALLALKAQLADPLRILADNWTTGTSFCHWVGVSCSLRRQRVTALSLVDTRLVGSLAPHIGNLSFLSILNLTSNNLMGSIPVELGRLHRLRYLDLMRNRFSDALPTTLGNLTRLVRLRLGYNELSGQIRPGMLIRMHNLKEIVLHQNELGGQIPLYLFNNTPSLAVIHLGNNSLSGPIPTALASLSMLEVFSVQHNQLSGLLPQAMFNMSKLRVMAFEDCGNLTGMIPTNQSFSLPMLQFFTLAGNKFAGRFPIGFASCQYLQALDLSRNSFVDVVPTWLAKLSQLKKLLLGSNNLTGFIPVALSNLTSLSMLALDNGNLKGEIPHELGLIHELWYLNLGQNQLTGSIPGTLEKLKSLASLDLSFNNLSGTIPIFLANLTYLTSLNLSFNSLVGQIPEGGVFSNLTPQSLIGNVRLQCLLPALTLAFGGIVIPLYLCIRKKLKKGDVKASVDPTGVIDHQIVSYQEIIRATNNFSEDNMLGSGSFGNVFKGQLSNGLVVAVKVIDMQLEEAIRSFDAECQVLRMALHRNLIKILNTCSNLDFRALVLQYMPKGSLEMILHRSQSSGHLGFLERLGIMIDVSMAMEYLHHEHYELILHCDLKPNNVLFDDEMTAHVADFGIARLILDDNSTICASMPGTVGYMAPGCRLDNGFLASVFEVGLRCSSDSPDQRMTMRDMVVTLKKIKAEYTKLAVLFSQSQARSVEVMGLPVVDGRQIEGLEDADDIFINSFHELGAPCPCPPHVC
uniref:Putative LRR receptor-like serine/threonine-protein kinase n=1 Tax=Aegilops tauschii TaxID=37682 RepID=N1QT47_AEGTA